MHGGGLDIQEAGQEIKKNIAMLYRSKKRWDFLFKKGKEWGRGFTHPDSPPQVGSRGEVRWVGGCWGTGGVAGVWRREDSPQLRVFLSNNNVIRIIHPRIPVTEESQ